MRTESKIGVVVGLAVVVAASVFFGRAARDERDVMVALRSSGPTPVVPIRADGPSAPGSKAAERSAARPTHGDPAKSSARMASGTNPSDRSASSERPPAIAPPKSSVTPTTPTSPKSAPPGGTTLAAGGSAAPGASSGALPITPATTPRTDAGSPWVSLRSSSSERLNEAARANLSGPAQNPATSGFVGPPLPAHLATAPRPQDEGRTPLPKAAPITETAVPKVAGFSPSSGSSLTDLTSESRSASDAAVSSRTEFPRTYVVRSGDTLGHIAHRTYGDARLAKRIAAANPSLADPHMLQAGMKLTLPAPEESAALKAGSPSTPATGGTPAIAAKQSETSGPSASPTVTPTVADAAPAARPLPTPLLSKSGATSDTLKDGGDAKSGTSTSADPGVPAGHRLAGGTTFTYGTPAEGGARTYKVQSGDSFFGIAKTQLGNGARWKELFELNKALVKGDPNRLRPGMVLTMPGESASGAAPAEPSASSDHATAAPKSSSARGSDRKGPGSKRTKVSTGDDGKPDAARTKPARDRRKVSTDGKDSIELASYSPPTKGRASERMSVSKRIPTECTTCKSPRPGKPVPTLPSDKRLVEVR